MTKALLVMPLASEYKSQINEFHVDVISLFLISFPYLFTTRHLADWIYHPLFRPIFRRWIGAFPRRFRGCCLQSHWCSSCAYPKSATQIGRVAGGQKAATSEAIVRVGSLRLRAQTRLLAYKIMVKDHQPGHQHTTIHIHLF